MEPDRLPEGLWPVMLTPFVASGAIDFPALEELTEFYLEHGAAGLFANCLSGEMYHLDDQERIDLIKAVLRIAEEKVPVVATGTFGYETGNQGEFIRKIGDLGVAAVVLITSQMAMEEESEGTLRRNFEIILQETGDIPLGLYECPSPYKRLLSPVLAGDLAKTGRFLYYKETSCNTREIRDKLANIKNSKLHLYNANTPTALESLYAGAHGLSPISSNFYPELYAWLYRLAATGLETEEASGLQQHLSIMDAVTRIKYPLNAKLFLSWRGLKINPITRIEVSPLNYEEIRMLEYLFVHSRQLAEKYISDHN